MLAHRRGGYEKDKVIQAERETLQGRWKLISFEAEGKEHPIPNDVFVTIDRDKFITELPKGLEGPEVTFSIDPTQKPKAIDFIVKGSAGKDVAMKDIYKLEKDTLTICTTASVGKPVANTERPKEFKTRDGHSIRVYKRVKK